MQTQHFLNLVNKLQSLPSERIAEVEDFIDFIKQRTEPCANKPYDKIPNVKFPVMHIKQWPTNLSLRRENMYHDDGR